MNSNAPASVWKNPIHFLAFGFGSGASPVMPGTMGTIVAIPIYLLFHLFGDAIYSLLTVGCFIGGVYLCDITSRDLGVHDHSGIVWDEIVGYLITMWFMPATWYWVILGFMFFRAFDICKPWPINMIDKKVKGGMGIMLDDVLAGLVSLFFLQVLRLLFL